MFDNPYLPRLPNYPMPERQLPIGEMVWINSKDELATVSVTPNKQKVFFLRDADNPIFYVVSANDIGMVSTSAYRFEELVERKPEERYVTKEEFQKLLNELGVNKNESAIPENKQST